MANAKTKTNTPKPLKHQWAGRPDRNWLRYCTACGVYEDREMFTSQSRSGITMRNVKVWRPYKQPEQYFADGKQPPCVPIENGPAEAPPPYVDGIAQALGVTLEKVGAP